MSISYPNSLDSFNNPSPSDDLNTAGVTHSEQHSNVNDAVEALQREVGVRKSGMTALDRQRLLMHNAGVLQAPPHLDPLTVAYPAFGTYDDEQGGWNLNLPATSPCNALAVTLGTNKSACWFGTRADGTETLGLDQKTVFAGVISETLPALSTSNVWSMSVVWAGSHTVQSQIAQWSPGDMYINFSGRLVIWDGTASRTATSSLATLLGVSSWTPIEIEATFNDAAISARVRTLGGSWVTAISVTGNAHAPSIMRVGRATAASTSGLGQWDYLRIYDGLPGAADLAHFTPSLFPAGSRTNGSTAVDTNDVTWTLTKPTTASTDEPKVVLPGARRFVMPGAEGTSVSTPDSVANSITGDIDVRVFFEAGSFVNPTVSGQYATFASKWEPAGQESWMLRYYRSGAVDQLNFVWNDGSTVTWSSRTVPTFVGVNGVRATLTVDDGSGTYVLRYYTTANGGETWDKLGVDATGAATAIKETTAPVVIGARGISPTSDLTTIDWTYAEIRDGIDGPVVSRFHVDDANPDAYTWVDPITGQTNTVTHSGAAGYKATLAEKDDTFLLFDGVNDFARVIYDMSVTDFDPAVGLSLVAYVRMHNTVTPGWGRVMSSAESVGDHGASMLRLNATPAIYGRMSDGSVTTQVGDSTGDNITYGVRTCVIAAYGSSDHEGYTDGISRETATDAVAAEPATEMLYFGMRPDGAGPLAFELHDFWVVRKRLPDDAVVTVTTEMGF